jgi:integrase
LLALKAIGASIRSAGVISCRRYDGCASWWAGKEILRHYLDRLNNEPTQFLRDLAKALILIARRWIRVDHDHLEALQEIKRCLRADRNGLTRKNRCALRQFESAENVARLVCLPEMSMAEAERQSPIDVRAAIKAQIAVAIEILVMAPMRAHNLTTLRLDRHVIRPGGPKGPIHLVLPESETKAGEAVEYALSPESTAFLDLYLRKYRPHLCPEDDPWLFPKTGGGCKAQATLSQQIVEAVHRHTGLTLTVHQFRHVAAKILLDREPGNFETVKHLLGHQNIKSPLNFYAEVQTTNAAKHYDELILSIRRRFTPNDGKPKK